MTNERALWLFARTYSFDKNVVITFSLCSDCVLYAVNLLSSLLPTVLLYVLQTTDNTKKHDKISDISYHVYKVLTCRNLEYIEVHIDRF